MSSLNITPAAKLNALSNPTSGPATSYLLHSLCHSLAPGFVFPSHLLVAFTLTYPNCHSTLFCCNPIHLPWSVETTQPKASLFLRPATAEGPVGLNDFFFRLSACSFSPLSWKNSARTAARSPAFHTAYEISFNGFIT